VPVCAAITTDGVTKLFTVTVTGVDVAVVGLAHPALEVSTTVIDAPLVRPDAVKLLLSDPALMLFTFH
jgi:hypothetical protein